MKKLFTFVALLATVFFTSCDKDEDMWGQDTNTVSYMGQFSSTSPAGLEFSLDGVEFIVVNEGLGVASIKMMNVKFVDEMPVLLTIDIPGVEYSTNDGDTQFTGDGIVPLVGEKPFNAYEIKRLNGVATINEFNVTFDCINKMGAVPETYSIKYTGTKK